MCDMLILAERLWSSSSDSLAEFFCGLAHAGIEIIVDERFNHAVIQHFQTGKMVLTSLVKHVDY
jgi:hypothetical protein